MSVHSRTAQSLGIVLSRSNTRIRNPGALTFVPLAPPLPQSNMGSVSPNTLIREPLKKGTSIDHLEYVDVTPIIGREYPTASLKEMLQAPNADEQLRDLAITICERGVAFFRAPQDDLSVDEQKYITDVLGKLTGRPAENGLHVHPVQ